MFFGNSKFKPLSGWHRLNPNSAKLNLGLTGDDKANRGLLLAYGDSDQEFVACSQGKAFAGFLGQDVNIEGLTMLNVAVTGNPDYPLRDTVDYATAWIPDAGALAEVEGSGAAALTNLVVTSGGTAAGALTANTPKGTLLSCSSGSLRVALSDDRPIAEVVKAGLTAENAGHVRVEIMFLGPSGSTVA